MASLSLIQGLTVLIAVNTVLMRVFSVLMPGNALSIPVDADTLWGFPVDRAAIFSYSPC